MKLINEMINGYKTLDNLYVYVFLYRLNSLILGPILFLEDDHYVAEDFIYMLKLMEKSCVSSCPQCSILSLGTYLKTYNFYGEAKVRYVFFITHYFIILYLHK